MDNADLGKYANIQIPNGYRFIAADAARALLDRMNDPSVPGLLGILEPMNGKWFAMLKFDEIGYIKDPDPKQVDFGAILKMVQNRHKNTNPAQHDTNRAASVQWAIEPKYDNSTHSLEWAFRAATQSGEVINHSVALLARRGVLNVTLVQPCPPSQARFDLVPLNELVRNIKFKQHEGYSDYENGDQVAEASLKELITGDSSPVERQQPLAAPLVSRLITRFYLAFGACILAAIGWLAYRKFIKRKSRRTIRTRSAFKSNGQKIGAAATASPRRKVFDHTRYFSDIILKVSGNGYGSVGPANGKPHTNGSVAMSAMTSGRTETELLAFQKIVIEEQRALLREQTWIIEEKTRLLAESRQLTEKWPEGA